MRIIKVFKLSELPKEYVEDLLKNHSPVMNTDGLYWQTHVGYFVKEVEDGDWREYFKDPKELEKYKAADKVFYAAGCKFDDQVLIEQD